MQPGDQRPLYRLLEDELQREVLTAVDIDGFFIDTSQSASETITMVGTSLSDIAVPHLFEDIELQVLDRRSEVIGRYYVGRVEVRGATPNARVAEATDLTASFFGYSYPFPRAGNLWRRWALGAPVLPGEWAGYPAEAHASWLHVVQRAWFSAGREARHYGDGATYAINGLQLANMASFYCALGEAINGPGGYFGSNLDALVDCLRSSWTGTERIGLSWSEFDRSIRNVGPDKLMAAVSILAEFGVEIS